MKGFPCCVPRACLTAAPGFLSLGAGERRRNRVPLQACAAESGSQTVRRGAAAEEPARLPEPDGSQGPVSHAETAEQEQLPPSPGPGSWDPFAGSYGPRSAVPPSPAWRNPPSARSPRGRPEQGLQRLAASFPGLCIGFPACTCLYLVI